MAEFLEWMMQADQMLGELISRYGDLVYLFLFLIIFIETGLVVIAFFPGDGLLFSAGIFAASGALELGILLPLLSLATIAGNTSNYFIGKYLGDQLVHAKKIRLIRRSHILRTNKYYEKYGGRALVLGRFIPIIRTMVPFVAGIGRMNFRSFFLFTLIGGMAWTLPLTLGGYFFGDIQWVQENFLLIYLLLWVLTLGPLLWDVIWMRTRTMFAKRPYPRTRWLRRNGRSDQD